MREPLLAPLAALAGGILVSRLAGFEVRELIWAHLALIVLAVFALWRGSRRAALLCCLVTLIFTGVLLDVLHRPGPAPVIDAGPQETVLIQGCVVEPSILSEGREQFTVALAPQARARVNLYFKETEKPLTLRYGQRVDLEGRIRRPHNYQNPGSFDYAGYLARRDIFWNISVSSPSGIRFLPGSCGSPLNAAIYSLRARALTRLDSLFGDSPEELAMLRAILLGESSQLEEVWKDRFRRTGTYHTLVISGLHLTVLAAFILFLLRICRLPQGWTLLVTTVIAWLYALVTGWNTPVIRAAAGLTLYLIGACFFRRRRLLNILAAIAIVFLVIDPEQMFDASFQLSFLAVAVIGALAVPIIQATCDPFQRGLSGLSDVDRDLHLPPRVAQFRVELRLLAETLWFWTRIRQRGTLLTMAITLRMGFYLLELAIVSAIIQLGLALPMAVYFHRVSFTGFLANPLIVPLMWISVPGGFLAILTRWSAVAFVTKWVVTITLKIVGFFATWETNLRIPAPPWWLIVCFLASLVLAALAVRHRRARVPALMAFPVCLGLLLIEPFAPSVQPGALEMTAIDVGQGDSLFVALPTGKLMMVDGGGIPARGKRKKPSLDIGEDVVSPYLWSRSIKRLDVLVSTHGHEDHISGLFALLKNFHPRELWVSALARDPAEIELQKAARKQGVKIVTLTSGSRFEYGGAAIDVLAPPDESAPSVKAHNDDSLVMRLCHGGHCFLLTGDIERPVERWLVEHGFPGQADVLKVPHHGSRTSTNPDFLSVVKPAFAVISDGFENPYDFPHREVIDRLYRKHVAVFRTDRDGFVTIRADGDGISIETWRWPVPHRPRFVRRSAF